MAPSTRGMACCVCGKKKATHPGTQLHLFPTDPKRRMQWVRLLNVNHKTTQAVCSDHFETKFHASKGRLLRVAVPIPVDGRDKQEDETHLDGGVELQTHLEYPYATQDINLPSMRNTPSISDMLPFSYKCDAANFGVVSFTQMDHQDLHTLESSIRTSSLVENPLPHVDFGGDWNDTNLGTISPDVVDHQKIQTLDTSAQMSLREDTLHTGAAAEEQTREDVAVQVIRVRGVVKGADTDQAKLTDFNSAAKKKVVVVLKKDVTGSGGKVHSLTDGGEGKAPLLNPEVVEGVTLDSLPQPRQKSPVTIGGKAHNLTDAGDAKAQVLDPEVVKDLGLDLEPQPRQKSPVIPVDEKTAAENILLLDDEGRFSLMSRQRFVPSRSAPASLSTCAAVAESAPPAAGLFVPSPPQQAPSHNPLHHDRSVGVVANHSPSHHGTRHLSPTHPASLQATSSSPQPLPSPQGSPLGACPNMQYTGTDSPVASHMLQIQQRILTEVTSMRDTMDRVATQMEAMTSMLAVISKSLADIVARR